MFLGLDLGTSALKVIVYRDTQIIAQTSAAYPMSNPKASWVEQDPALWTSALNTCLMALRQTVNLRDVIGVGLTGQMHGLVTLDKHGKVLRPAILWNDNRAVAQAVELNNTVPNIGMIAGIPALPSFPAVKMRWIKQHEPEIFTSIHKVLMPKDYISFCLHGAYVTDHSDAAASLWYDQTAQVGQKQYVQRQTRVWINCPTFGLAIRLPATSLHRRQRHLVCPKGFLCLQGRAIASVALLRWAL